MLNTYKYMYEKVSSDDYTNVITVIVDNALQKLFAVL